MTKTNAVEQLIRAGTGTEVWWDSSPLIYEAWLNGPGAPHREAGLFRLQDGQNGPQISAESLLTGATTNQPLTQQVVEKWPDMWAAWLARQKIEVGGPETLWRLFIEVAARGADMLAPVFEATDRRRGQICCQVDPRDMTDLDAILVQARLIHAARPNIMVKLPGTAQGVEAVRLLTAEGIPTNVTLGFTVSQLVAVGEAAAAGLAESAAPRDRHGQLAVVCGDDAGPVRRRAQFAAEARARGIELTPADLRWAGIAIFRRAHRLYRARGYPAKLMAASMRIGPEIDGQTHVWHLEKLAGADAVLTVFPNIFEAFLTAYTLPELPPQIDDPVPDEVLERLMRIPYFASAYDEHGMEPAEWVRHPALVATGNTFAHSMEAIERFAVQCSPAEAPSNER